MARSRKPNQTKPTKLPQLPRVIEGGVDINDSREFELHPKAALATMGGWAAPQGKVVCSPLCPGVQPPPQY